MILASYLEVLGFKKEVKTFCYSLEGNADIHHPTVLRARMVSVILVGIFPLYTPQTPRAEGTEFQSQRFVIGSPPSSSAYQLREQINANEKTMT